MNAFMTSRRHFLTASAVGVLAGGALGSTAGAATLARSGARISIGETFVPAEWSQAFAATAAGGHPGDSAFWRAFRGQASTPAPLAQAELHLLALPAPGVEAFSPDLARRVAALSNDRLADRVRAGRGAIGGLATVSSFDAQAAREAERAIAQLGLSGVALGANRGMRLDHPSLWPLYEYAQAAHAPIYLPAAYSAGADDAPYRALGREGVIAGAAADSSAHAAQLIFGGVLDAFPKLNVILARLGEATPHWYGELEAVEANMAEAGLKAPQRAVRDYFTDNIHLTTTDMVSAETVQFCNLVLGDGRVLRSRDSAQLAQLETGSLTRVSLAGLRRQA